MREVGILRRALVVALVLVGACGCPGSRTTGEVLEVDASDAVLQRDVSRLRVRGTARLDDAIDHPVALVTETAEPRGKPVKWFHLVPVVDDAWSEDDPIPLWITCASAEADVASWQRALASALSRGPIEVEVVARAGLQPREKARGWHDALQALAEAGGPVSDPRAPIAEWPLP